MSTHPNTDPNPSLEIDEHRVGWITFDDPDRAVNVLTEAVMLRFGERLDEARAAAREGRVTALVVRSGKSGSFVVGADVDAIAGLESPTEAESKVRTGQTIFNDVASLPVPTVAAVNGSCLGGGLELALACDVRIAADHDGTVFQFPEVMLGILPAWGGTTRLPRLIGLQPSLDMLLSGRRVRAARAKRLGLVKETVAAPILDQVAGELARRVAEQGPSQTTAPGKKGLSRLVEATGLGRKVVLGVARKKVMEGTGGHYPAPLRILELLDEHLGGSIEESLAAEARAAAELIVSPVCKNLVHVYHLRENARKGTGVRGGDAEPQKVRMLGVLGAGVMGGGIAHLAADRGVPTYMKDIRHAAVTSGLQHARERFWAQVRRGRADRHEAEHKLELISGGLEYHGLSSADVVVEAVVERLDVKRDVLHEAERHVSSDCVLATNTSSLSVDAMAEALDRPERFCGMHFFNPVHRMPLVEVICGARTSDRAVATVYRFALDLGKVPVVVGDGPGFLVNRILGPYLNEAGFLLGEGVSVEHIDRVATEFGMPMGPLRLVDEVGIDVSRHAGAALHEALGDRLAPSPALTALGETDRLGKKGGRGFYRYEKGEEQGVDDDVYAIIGRRPEEDAMDDREIRRRLLVPMVNEAARLLEEGIVRSAADVDLAMIMGTGFPPFRGGLLRFADTQHVRSFLERTRALRQELGDRFEPAPLMEELAREDRGFYDAFPREAMG